jgi:ferritin-like metal-binding protein YciE
VRSGCKTYYTGYLFIELLKIKLKMAERTETSGLLDFFLERTLDLYYAEKRFIKCFVALSIAAFTDELRIALNTPSTEAEAHIDRLGQILKSLNKKLAKRDCEVVASLSHKADGLIRKNEPGTAIRDAAMIYAAQLIEHYKVASYEVLHAAAVELQLEQAAMLLEQCLAEEKQTSAYLTQIARNIINPAAKAN